MFPNIGVTILNTVQEKINEFVGHDVCGYGCRVDITKQRSTRTYVDEANERVYVMFLLTLHLMMTQ